MTDSTKPQIISAAILIVIAILLVNPSGIWMPTAAHMLVLASVVVVAGIFGVFVMAEGAGDERDESHKMIAGRAGFLVGGGILLIGIITETLAHALDPWLVGALVGMVVAKVGMRVWNARRF